MDESIKLNKKLTELFNVRGWSVKEKNLFLVIKKFYDRYNEKFLIESVIEDIKAIRSNLKDLNWYSKCKNQCSISTMLSTLKIEHVRYIKEHQITLLSISIKIFNYSLIISYYNNSYNGCNYCNYYIYFMIDNKKYYIAYYNKVIGMSFNDTSMAISSSIASIPEIDAIHIATRSDLTKNELLMFLIEIILYYDQSGEIGNLPLTHITDITLNKIHETGEKVLSKEKSPS